MYLVQECAYCYSVARCAGDAHACRYRRFSVHCRCRLANREYIHDNHHHHHHHPTTTNNKINSSGSSSSTTISSRGSSRSTSDVIPISSNFAQ